MYKIYCDGKLICDSRVDELAVINPSGHLEVNKAGTFSFVIPPNHPYYELISNRKSIIDVYRGNSVEPLFEGICVNITDDFFKQRTIECEGELTFLNDSIQRPAKYQNMTPRTLLGAYINVHNSQVEDKKKFSIGSVTVNDSENIFRYTNYQSTLSEISDDLIDNYGGYIRTRHENGTRYIDYLAESPNTCSQIIKLGKNLLDLSKNIDSTEIATAIIPLGATLDEEDRTSEAVEGLDERVTIKSVNDGKDYIYNQEAVDTFGWITQVITFDGVTSPSSLKIKGEKYLSEAQFEKLIIQAKAVDLNLTNDEIENFKLLDMIRVVSDPHGLNKYFMLSKLEFNLNQPQNDVVTLGIEEKSTMTSKSQSVNSEIIKLIEQVQPNSILKQASENATSLINSAMGGYVYKTQNELYIMDTNNPDTATKVWRWNINGLGYSKNGINGPYQLAMTMDGAFVADFITTGKMLANRIYGGTLELGKVSNEAGVIVVYSNSGAEILRIDRNGFYLKGNFFSVNTPNFICNSSGVEIKGDIEAESLLYHDQIKLVSGDYYDESDKTTVIGLAYADTTTGTDYYNLAIGLQGYKRIGGTDFNNILLTDIVQILGDLQVDGKIYTKNSPYEDIGGNWERRKLGSNVYEYIYQANIGSSSFSSYGALYYRNVNVTIPAGNTIKQIKVFNANVFSNRGLYGVSMYNYSNNNLSLFVFSAKNESASQALNIRMIVEI